MSKTFWWASFMGCRDGGIKMVSWNLLKYTVMVFLTTQTVGTIRVMSSLAIETGLFRTCRRLHRFSFISNFFFFLIFIGFTNHCQITAHVGTEYNQPNNKHGWIIHGFWVFEDLYLFWFVWWLLKTQEWRAPKYRQKSLQVCFRQTRVKRNTRKKGMPIWQGSRKTKFALFSWWFVFKLWLSKKENLFLLRVKNICRSSFVQTSK